MRSRISEKSVVERIQKNFKQIPHAKLIKTHGDPRFSRGEPDLIGCVRGRMVCFEVKAPGGKATKLQLQRLHEWHDAGALTALVYSWGDVVDALATIGVTDV